MNAATRNRILEQAQGNPLGLVELLAGAARAQSGLELPARAAASTRLERTFAARVADLPHPTRTALLVAALTDRADVTEVLDAAGRVEHTPLALDVLTPAVTAGLVDVDELRLRFGHPLMRSAIGQSGPRARTTMPPTPRSRRRSAQDPARSLWHRVAAASGADDALADELAAVSSRAIKRGSIVTAAETLGRAAALTEHEPSRGARLLGAAELALDIGRDDLVARLLADAGPLVLTSADLPRRVWLQRISRRTAPEPGWFEAHVDRIDELLAAGDPVRASQALVTVAFRSWWSPAPPELRARMVAAGPRPPGRRPSRWRSSRSRWSARRSTDREVRGLAGPRRTGRPARRTAAAGGGQRGDRRRLRSHRRARPTRPSNGSGPAAATGCSRPRSSAAPGPGVHRRLERGAGDRRERRTSSPRRPRSRCGRSPPWRPPPR